MKSKKKKGKGARKREGRCGSQKGREKKRERREEGYWGRERK